MSRDTACVFILSLAILVGALASSGNTLFVPQDYPTIQAAVDAAQPGDTVRIASGRYTENLIIEKSVQVIGSGRQTTRIEAQAPNEEVVRICVGEGSALLSEVFVAGGKHGVLAIAGTSTEIGLHHLGIDACSQSGVFTYGAGAVLLDDVFVNQGNEGIGVVLQAAHVEVVSSEIINGDIGLWLVGPVGALISGCTVALSPYAIECYSDTCGCAAESSLAFRGQIRGEGNRVYGTVRHLCPDGFSTVWPANFVVTEWIEPVRRAVDAYDTGWEAYAEGDTATALFEWEDGCTTLAATSFDYLEAWLQEGCGDLYAGQGRLPEALAAYEAAADVYAMRGSEAESAQVAIGEATVLAHLHRCDEALPMLLSARTIFEFRHSALEVAEVDTSLGEVYGCLHQYEEALASLNRAHATFDRYGMHAELARVNLNLGMVLLARDQLDASLTTLEEALATFERLGREADAATARQSIGNVYARLGRHDEALSAYESAGAHFATHNMVFHTALVRQNLGSLYLQLGRYEDALASFFVSIDTFKALGMQADVLLVMLNLGLTQAFLAQYEQALDILKRCRDGLLDLDMAVEAAYANQRIGMVQFQLGMYEDAALAYQSAQSVFTHQGMELARAATDQNLGVIYYSQACYNEALDAFARAYDVFAAHQLEIELASVASSQGAVFRATGRPQDALASFRFAAGVFTDHGLRQDAARQSSNIGEMYRDLGRHEDALQMFQSALSMLNSMPCSDGEAISSPAERWPILFNRGLAQEALGDYSHAIESYMISIEIAESIRGALVSERLKIAWQERIRCVYEHLIDLLYRTGDGSSALSYVERCRSRSFLDLLSRGPIGTLDNIAEEGIRTGIVDASAIDADLGSVVAQLPENAMVLEYFVTDVTTYLWCVSQSSIQGPVQLPFGHTALMEQVIACRQAIEAGDPMADFHLTVLYNSLIAPIEELLPRSDNGEEVPHLIIIPSGPLYYLPFQALLWGRDDREQHTRLIERYAISYAPSMATLKYTQQRVVTTDTRSLVALADPDSGESSWGRLPEAQTESQRVAALFPVAEVYVDTDATETIVQSQSSVASDLLFATHGKFSTVNPMYSYLLLSPTEDSDGRLLTYEIFGLALDANLVTLSACETLLPSIADMEDQVRATRGLSDTEPVQLTQEQLEAVTAGDELAGLTRAFLYAGTSSVLSSLWSVYSQATADLMVAFYEGIQANLGKASALREAQLEIMNTPGYEHSVYWAAFNLMGDWR